MLIVIAVALGILAPIKIGYDYYVKDYHSELTAKVYNDTVNENVNIVFYKKGCPYCEAGISKVNSEAKQSDVTTFYVDVESEDGNTLVDYFNIEKAASIVKIRDGKSTLNYYAYDDKNGDIAVNNEYIEEVFAD
ncbi:MULTISPECIES: conjugal transfer protein TraF [Streptococcus]|uniref:conjugal transfer protein TraF n=1 Tax=Streptococcus TaxID=1301 RepID=UPI002097F057|nr:MULTISPECIES: conjugal transfer protein TraF [Streptococcus]MCO7179469.1 conjugal transfer protein TraF [Streptococcus gallolyticus]MCO7182194.1 conjugal transfer protein TraF [Streptococcus gallolyticus]